MVKLSRLPDWKKRLVSYLSEVRNGEIQFGSNGCVHFCSGAIKSVTGLDIAPDLVNGKSSTEKSPKKIIASHKNSVERAVSYHVQEFLVEIPVSQANQGDLIYSGTGPLLMGKKLTRGPSIGICLGSLVAFYVDGLKFEEMSIADRCWTAGN